MASTATERINSEPDYGAEVMADPNELGRLLGPVMAGARARGVADAFELMGVAAVLLDGAGRVLHAGGRAERALRPLVRVAEGHLVGADARSNALLQTVMEAALSSDTTGGEGRVQTFEANGRPLFTMKAIRFPKEGPEAVQLLHAILIVTEI